jgi:hypothetical protein
VEGALDCDSVSEVVEMDSDSAGQAQVKTGWKQMAVVETRPAGVDCSS